jgi:hypothetical protein
VRTRPTILYFSPDGCPVPSLVRQWAAEATATMSASSGSGQLPTGEDVVVAVFRTGESIGDVMQRISRRL